MKKRKDGYYRVSRTIDGKVYYFYGKTQSEAKRKPLRGLYMDCNPYIALRRGFL